MEFTKQVSPAANGLTKKRVAPCSLCWMNWKCDWPHGVSSLGLASSRRTGGSSARSCALMRRIVDYENLQGYLRDIYQQPGIAETVNFDHIKRHYYFTHDDINPTRIVPIGPALDLGQPPGRDRM